MADFDWPADIVPYAVLFYLQPHSGGSESPFSRKTKVYGLSAPRWIARLELRGGDSVQWGRHDKALYGQRLDALLAKVKGRQNRLRLWDFRRPRMSGEDWSAAASNLAAAAGATSMVITGLSPYARAALAGDYVGGDARPHIVLEDAVADASGNATVTFEPPLAAAIAAGAAVFGKATGLFRLTSDDAGQNMSEVGQLTHYTLDFVEDL